MNALLLAQFAFAEPDAASIPDALRVALSGRHPVPCETLRALTPNPAADLSRAVNHLPYPPWAPMRAARCLLLEPGTDAVVAGWVTDPERLGLAQLVFDHLDELPTARSVTVVERALTGPWSVEARRAARSSNRREVRAVAER
jgi:hypothetical protein